MTGRRSARRYFRSSAQAGSVVKLNDGTASRHFQPSLTFPPALARPCPPSPSGSCRGLSAAVHYIFAVHPISSHGTLQLSTPTRGCISLPFREALTATRECLLSRMHCQRAPAPITDLQHFVL